MLLVTSHPRPSRSPLDIRKIIIATESNDVLDDVLDSALFVLCFILAFFIHVLVCTYEMNIELCLQEMTAAVEDV